MGTPNSNGAATPKEKAGLNNHVNGTNGTAKPAPAPEPAKSNPVQEPTAEQLANQRWEKRERLASLYEAVDKLRKTRKQFDTIDKLGELTICIKADEEFVFVTSRTDTVQDTLKAIESSIDRKLAEANKQLAEFEF